MDFLVENMYVIIFLLIIFFILLSMCLVQINENERGIKFSVGNFHSVLNPGFRFIIPIIQSCKKVDISPKKIEISNLTIITRDNRTVNVNAIIHCQIFDPAKAMLEVDNYYVALVELSKITIRNVANSITSDEILNRRERTGSSICDILNKSADAWGIKVSKVELVEVNVIKK